MVFPPEEQYVVSLKEVACGGLLVALTVALHGCAMLGLLRLINRTRLRMHGAHFARDLGKLVVAAWIIALAHLAEVIPWAAFISWVGAVPSTSSAFYLSLMDYTTLGSPFNLPRDWRLLEGMIGMAGLMTFAWSTSVLFTLAARFQDRYVREPEAVRETVS